jgi:glyoxylase-like metal-dependent hydrolase (beta-lactamase superfamily II)
VKEIVRGVFTWSHFSAEKQLDFNGWCLPSKDGTIVVDPPQASEETLKEIEKLGHVNSIVLTNKDHVRRSDEYAARFRAPILIHQADAPMVSIRIGGVFKSGDALPGGLEAWRVADAKSPGECALLVRDANALILGDALIGKPKGELNLLPASKLADPAKAIEGIRALLKLPFDAVLVGDGTPIPKGGRKAIEEFLKRAH